MAEVIIVMVIVIAFLSYKFYESHKEKELRKLVSWSVIGDYCPTLNSYSYNRELFITIMNTQHKYGIKKKYCITEETEEEYMREIIEEFQKEMARSYFRGVLKTVKGKYTIREEHYFMLSLFCFLTKHQCDSKFLGYDMHKERVSFKDYGNLNFDATYTLTDFAIVYHKMYYITRVFYNNCKPLIESNLALPYNNEKAIEEILNTKQIELSTH
jgi:hypothetical protein